MLNQEPSSSEAQVGQLQPSPPLSFVLQEIIDMIDNNDLPDDRLIDIIRRKLVEAIIIKIE